MTSELSDYVDPLAMQTTLEATDSSHASKIEVMMNHLTKMYNSSEMSMDKEEEPQVLEVKP